MPEIAEFEIIGKTDQAVKNVGKLNDEIKKTEKTTKKPKMKCRACKKLEARRLVV